MAQGKDTTTLLLPDTLAHWPWARALNVHYPEAKRESSEWFNSFHAFGPKSQKAFNLCDFSLLSSLAFPTASKDVLRVACDLMHLFFVFDEYSDRGTQEVVRQQADAIMNALRSEEIPLCLDGAVLYGVTAQFWQRAVQTSTAETQYRFIQSFAEYTDAVVQQASDRDNTYIRDVGSYLTLRRATIGAKPCFVILEFELGIPPHVLQQPAIEQLTEWAIDLLILGNDLCSYNVEQYRGDDKHNMVTIIQHQLHCDLASAISWIAEYHDEVAANFLTLYHELPSTGSRDLDEKVLQYVWGLGNWVRANDCWSFESWRYFGTNGEEVMNTRLVKLLLKDAGQNATADLDQ